MIVNFRADIITIKNARERERERENIMLNDE